MENYDDDDDYDYKIENIENIENNNEINGSINILYFDSNNNNKQELMVKLSALCKEDQKVENKNEVDKLKNMTNNLSLSSNNNIELTTNTHLHPYLTKYLIHNILTYFDTKTIINNYLFLNKDINHLFDLKLITRNFCHEGELRVSNSRKKVYCSVEMSDFIELGEILFDVEVNVVTKDQGWKSVGGSYSWVHLKVGISEELTEWMTVAYNSAEKNYRNVRSILSGNQNSKCTKSFLNLISNNQSRLEVYGACLYAGWECYIKSVSIDFRVIGLRR